VARNKIKEIFFNLFLLFDFFLFFQSLFYAQRTALIPMTTNSIQKQREYFVVATIDQLWGTTIHHSKGANAKNALENFLVQNDSNKAPLQFVEIYSNWNAYDKGKKSIVSYEKEPQAGYNKRKQQELDRFDAMLNS